MTDEHHSGYQFVNAVGSQHDQHDDVMAPFLCRERVNCFLHSCGEVKSLCGEVKSLCL